jgi:hypothetical protein
MVTVKAQDYHNIIITQIAPKETFNKISEVSNWWSKKFEGSSSKLDDIFTVRFKREFI